MKGKGNGINRSGYAGAPNDKKEREKRENEIRESEGKGLKVYTVQRNETEKEKERKERGRVSTYIWPPPSDVHPRTSKISAGGFF
jgi:hypothetical protein